MGWWLETGWQLTEHLVWLCFWSLDLSLRVVESREEEFKKSKEMT